MSNLYKKKFINKYTQHYILSFFTDEGKFVSDAKGHDFFKGCIAVAHANRKKDVEIWFSQTLASGIWKLPEDKMREITHEIGIVEIKIQLNNKPFEELDNKIVIDEYKFDDRRYNSYDIFKKERKKVFDNSTKKRIGFKR